MAGYIGSKAIIVNSTSSNVTGDLTVDTNTLYVDSTNNRVGVGTTTPATALDVTGTVTADGLTVDTNTLHVDSTNNRVGVGTTAPEASLHVTTASGDTVLILEADPTNTDENDTPYIIFRADGSTGTTALVGLVGNSGDHATGTESNALLIEATGSRAVQVAPGSSVSAHFDPDGNVGIGTSSPTEALSVAGNISVTGTVDGRDVAADGTKLDGIEAGATADQTAAEILTSIKTVDGAGSGLDADLLDGNQASAFSLTSHNHTLDSLSNTTITTNTSGEILKWNGTAWVNNTLAEAGIQPAGSYLTGNQTITLSGDASGSGTTSIVVTVADDSHNHVISNVDGLQTALDAKLNLSGGTVTGTLNASTFNATSTTNGGFQGIDADSATSPSFTWSADLNTGMYRPAADQIGFTTGGTVACTITGSNFNVVGTLNAPTVDTNSVVIGAGVTLTEATDRADLLKITSSTAGWGGIQISNTSNEFLWSFMGDGTVGGIYDDLSNAWAIQFDDGGEVRLYYAGAEKLNTHSTGVTITGHLRPTFINWDNTGTAVIVASNNVSSGTDRSVGVWTTNFSVTWPAVNYGMAGGVNANAGTGNAAISFNTANSGNQYTTTAMGQASEDVDAGYTDYNNNTVIYYG